MCKTEKESKNGRVKFKDALAYMERIREVVHREEEEKTKR